jgi:DNA-binding SARP family transcriptional activator
MRLALEAAAEAQGLVDAAGNLFNGAVFRVVNAGILIAAGDLDAAERRLGEARALVAGTGFDALRAYIALNEAHAAHLRGLPLLRNERLAEALALGRTEGGKARLRWYPEAMSVLFPVALAENIETDLVTTLIREFAVTPNPTDVEDWPWAIKLYTLGRFELLVDDRPPAFTRKPPRRTLAVLQALVAFGAREVPEERVVAALWPEEDGDAGHRALGAALHRLRKILRDPGAIRQGGGKLSLDLRRCWVDAIVFEQGVATVPSCPSTPLEAAVRALSLYRGAFLPAEEDAGWAMSTRERLRGKFIQAVASYASRLEEQGQYQAAIDHYLRGLDADSLVEPFYQGLMRCYRRLDRQPDLAGAYRRLRQTLSVVLGVAPSPATEKLYRQLRL